MNEADVECASAAHHGCNYAPGNSGAETPREQVDQYQGTGSCTQIDEEDGRFDIAGKVRQRDEPLAKPADQWGIYREGMEIGIDPMAQSDLPGGPQAKGPVSVNRLIPPPYVLIVQDPYGVRCDQESDDKRRR